jgi:hypothetical protein
MTEIYDKKYVPVGDDHRIFVRDIIPAADLAVGVPFRDGLFINWTGYGRQGLKISPIDSGGGPGPQVEVRIFEKVNGTFKLRTGLGVATINSEVVFEHNSEDMARESVVELTPLIAVPDGGIFIEISGRRSF